MDKDNEVDKDDSEVSKEDTLHVCRILSVEVRIDGNQDTPRSEMSNLLFMLTMKERGLASHVDVKFEGKDVACSRLRQVSFYSNNIDKVTDTFARVIQMARSHVIIEPRTQETLQSSFNVSDWA